MVDGVESSSDPPIEADTGGSANLREIRLSVPSMDCSSCVSKVEGAIRDLPIDMVEPRAGSGIVVVRFDPDRVAQTTITEAIENAGYEVTSVRDSASAPLSTDDRSRVWTSARGIKTWISGVFLALGLALAFVLVEFNGLLVSISGREILLADAFFLIATAVAGEIIFRNGLQSLRQRSLDIDLLMSIAIVGAITAGLAFGESLYFEAAMLAFLFSVAELLERYSMDRARSSLRELLDLSPETATVKRDGEEETVAVESVSVGEVVVVRPGEKIPVDGEVLAGDSAVDQAPITGESLPVDKTIGDEVYAGTINEEGYLEIETTAGAGEHTLARIIKTVEDAEANKTDREQFVDRFASYYTPLVVAAGVLLAIVPPVVFGASWVTYIVYGLTLFVLACPCAFVISTPVSVVSGITSAAKNGVLIKGGNHLEAMGAVDAVAFDKTGTLTKGELTVTDVIPLNDNSEEDVLRCARGLEARSEHPIGDAIVQRAGGASDLDREVSGFESLTGQGVRAELDGTTHFAGKPALFEDLGFDLGHVHAATDGGLVTQKTRELCERNQCLDLLDGLIPELQANGKTVVLVGTDEELEGLIAVADEVRPDARRTIERLHALGIDEVVMLTGDNERTARAIAEDIGVDSYRAELLPEEKVQAVRDLEARHDGVAMVGDGVNDAPALATASVGIAMGAAGTDTAIETADIALLGDDLTDVPYVCELAENATDVIRQNVWSSLAVKAGLAVGVPFGMVPVWLAVLVGDAGMTTAVTANAMRLSRITPDTRWS